MDYPSYDAFETPEEYNAHAYQLSRIAPTQLIRELTVGEFENILEYTDGITWTPENRIQIAETSEHEYQIHTADGSTNTVWLTRDGTTEKRNIIRFEPGFPATLQWTLITEIFEIILTHRTEQLEASSTQTDAGERVVTPTQHRLEQVDEYSAREYQRAADDALGTLIDNYYERVEQGDYQELRDIVTEYHSAIDTATKQYLQP